MKFMQIKILWPHDGYLVIICFASHTRIMKPTTFLSLRTYIPTYVSLGLDRRK